MAWMPPLHRLLSPITADTGATIEQVQLKPLYYAAQKDALARAGEDEDDQFFELAKLATGLSEKELDQLKRPDYVTIAQFVHEMSTRPASFFLGEPAPSSHEQPVQLLLPVDAGGRTHAELELEMPALRATKVMKKLATAKNQDQVDALLEELVDRFGKLPTQAQTLIDTHRLRVLAKPYGVAKVDAAPGLISISFKKDAPIEPLRIIELIQKNKHIKLAGNDKLRIERALPEPKARAQMVRDVLRSLGQPVAVAAQV